MPVVFRPLDAAREDQRRMREHGGADLVEARMRRRDFGEQRFVDFGIVDRKLARLDAGKEHALLARAFLFERVLDVASMPGSSRTTIASSRR